MNDYTASTIRLRKRWKDLSINTKLTVGVIGTIFVILLINTLINYNMAHRSIINGLNQNMTAEAQKTALHIENKLQEGVATVESISHNPLVLSLMSKVQSKDGVRNLAEYGMVVQTFKKLKSSKANFNLVYIGLDQAGYLLDDTEWVNPADYVLKERDWYKSIVNTGGLYVTKAYQDKITGKMVVTIGKTIYSSNGKLLGVAAVDYAIDGISQIMKNFKLGETGYAFLLDQDGVDLYHPIAEKILKENATQLPGDIGVIAKKMVQGESGTGHYTYENSIRYLGYAPIIASHWSVGIVVPQAEVERSVNKFRVLSLIIFILSILSIGLLLRYLTTSILRPIPGLLSAFQKAANGDLTVNIPVQSNDEIGKLSVAFNQMISEQHQSVASISEASGKIKLASEEIAAGNHDLSQRTQEEASTLEEIASTIEEMTASIQQTAANSSQADHVSQTTLEVVNEGEKAIVETIDAMSQITQSSREIGEIIKVVNDIAFQTNLLALNAAVEAARAGEQGRGFAVVAAEVRNLAGRTTESSKEIEKLIKESLERVEKGNVSVRKSGEMLKQIVDNTKHNSDMVVEIGSAIREQATAANQIQNAIAQMNQVTQQNAAMVQEMAASSESLNMEADTLNEMVSKFVIEEEKSHRQPSKTAIQRKNRLSDPMASTPVMHNKTKTYRDFNDDDLSRF